ncbi:MAG: WecB/TagA/CpsF family glycosyltransferase [Chloroflexota bacterium]
MPDRILLVQLADIGDLIVTLPAIAALRSALPDAHLTLLTSEQAVSIVEDGLVDEVRPFSKQGFNGTKALLNPANWRRLYALREDNFDTVIFFHHFTLRLGTLKFWLLAWASGAEMVLGLDNGNTTFFGRTFLTHTIPDEGFGAKHQAQYWLDLVGLLGADTAPQRARIAFDGGILPLTVKRGVRVILHAGGGGYTQARRWSPERWAQVADNLREEYDAEIVLVGTENDNATAVLDAMQHREKVVNLSGRTSLTQLADVMRSADLYLGTDSGVTHLAAAVRTPVVALYGATNHEAWSPWSPNGNVAILRSAPLCSPCIYVEHSIGAREGCEARTCMRMISVEQVLSASRTLLRNERFQSPADYRYDARSGRDWVDRVQILGLPVDIITYKQWLWQIDQWILQGKRAHQVCTVNPEFMMMAQHDPLFAQIIRRADLCVPDGNGVLWASNLLGTKLPERVTGSDGVPKIAEEAAKKGWTLFFLGAAEGVAEEAARVLQAQYRGLFIVGTYSGSPAVEEEDKIIEMINASNANILLVAYGAPAQDKWIARNLPRLNVAMAMGVGGTFDFIAGRVPRAPQWMIDYKLEWLYRLYKEPWRIVRMMRLPRFVFAVIARGSK